MCYAHSVLLAWLWSCWPIAHPDTQVFHHARQFIRLLLQVQTQVRLTNFWGWSHLTRAWQEPRRQHDVARFTGRLDCKRLQVSTLLPLKALQFYVCPLLPRLATLKG